MTDEKLRRTTIRDVAAEANVSISTVSLYVQGRPGVGQDTGQRIAAAIEKLGYVPRTRARNGAKSNIFGLLVGDLPVPAFSDRFYGEVIRAIEAEARIHGYSMLFSIIEPNQLPQMVVENQVKGLMILGGSAANDALAAQLVDRDIPLILVDNYVSGLRVNAVVPDNANGGYMAFKHLADLGHRHIAVIEGPRNYKTLTDRLYGALRAADELEIKIPANYRQASLSTGRYQKGYLEMQHLLALSRRPSAVFAISDKTALGALEAIKEDGLRVPQDISIVGFDDVADTIPPLTTIGVSKREMGVLAMKRLVAVVEGSDAPPVRSCIDTQLIVRQSTTSFRSQS